MDLLDEHPAHPVIVSSVSPVDATSAASVKTSELSSQTFWTSAREFSPSKFGKAR
jgi:hypothetical protein